MSADSPKRLREQWVRRAAELDRRRHFSNYSRTQRDEVLRKGYLGRWRPDEALRIAKAATEKGHDLRKPKLIDEIRDHFNCVGEEVRRTLLELLEEVPPESYDPPATLEEPPGYPFLFRSETLRGEVYLKFQIAGTKKKARVLFWSCHPPVY